MVPGRHDSGISSRKLIIRPLQDKHEVSCVLPKFLMAQCTGLILKEKVH